MMMLQGLLLRVPPRCPSSSIFRNQIRPKLNFTSFSRSRSAGSLDRSSTTKLKPAAEAGPVATPPSLWYHRLGPVSTFFSWFHKNQVKRPLTVQLWTTIITYLLGDLLAQNIGGEEYDPWRTLRMLTIGGLASLPGYKWFMWLGRNFNYPSKFVSVAVKVCVQQAVFTPIFNTYFFGMQAALTGESISGIIDRITSTVPTSVVNSLKFWPAVTAVTFTFVAPPYRFMFSGLFAICWQAYLSFLNRREEKREVFELTEDNPAMVRN